MKSPARNKSLTTKMTEQEYDRIAQMAFVAHRNISEWVRELLFREIGQSSSAEHLILLSEVLALRAIILNLSFRSNAQEKLTQQEMLDLISRADQGKTHKAQQRLREAESGNVNASNR